MPEFIGPRRRGMFLREEHELRQEEDDRREREWERRDEEDREWQSKGLPPVRGT